VNNHRLYSFPQKSFQPLCQQRCCKGGWRPRLRYWGFTGFF